MTTGRVCVVGSINIDTTLRVPVLPGPGETILATGRASSPGGKGANQAVAAAALGSQVRFIGAVGSDENAATGLAALADRGIDTTGVRRLEEAPTGTAIVVVANDGENLIIVDPAANDQVDAGWVGEALGDCSGEVVMAQLEVPVEGLLAAARAHPAMCVLNPAPAPEAAALAELLPHVDVLVPNRAELGQLVGRAAPSTLAEVAECAAALDFAGSLVVTLGHHRAGRSDCGAGGCSDDHRLGHQRCRRRLLWRAGPRVGQEWRRPVIGGAPRGGAGVHQHPLCRGPGACHLRLRARRLTTI